MCSSRYLCKQHCRISPIQFQYLSCKSIHEKFWPYMLLVPKHCTVHLNSEPGHLITLCLLVSSADNFCKQFGPRSGPTKCWAWSGSQTVWHSDGLKLQCLYSRTVFFSTIQYNTKFIYNSRRYKKFILKENSRQQTKKHEKIMRQTTSADVIFKMQPRVVC